MSASDSGARAELPQDPGNAATGVVAAPPPPAPSSSSAVVDGGDGAQAADVDWEKEIRRQDETFWTGVQALTLVVFFSLVMAIVMINAYDFQGDVQAQLIGTTVRHSLRVMSTGADATLILARGASSAEMTLDEDEDLAIDASGGRVRVRSEMVLERRLEATEVEATEGGFIFPDGSTMTTAAETLAGLSSEADLNLVSGTGDGSGAIILTTEGRERLRIRSTGESVFRGLDPSSGEIRPMSESIVVNGSSGTVTVGGRLELSEGGLRALGAGAALQLDSGSGGAVRLAAGGGDVTLVAEGSASRPASLTIAGSSMPNGTAAHEDVGGDVSIVGGSGNVTGAVSIGATQTSRVSIGGAGTALALDGASMAVNVAGGVRLSAGALGASNLHSFLAVEAADDHCSPPLDGSPAALSNANLSAVHRYPPSESGFWSVASSAVTYTGPARAAEVSVDVEAVALFPVGASAPFAAQSRAASCGVYVNGEESFAARVLAPIFASQEDVVADAALTMSARRVVALSGGDELSVRCAVSTSGLLPDGTWSADYPTAPATWKLTAGRRRLSVLVL